MKQNFLNQLIIISYLTLLVFHFLVGRKYNIYPSLVFPAFSQAPHVDDIIEYPDITFYAITNKNQLKPIKKDSFFNGYKKHVNYFLSTIITNEQKIKTKPSLLPARAAFLSYSIRQLKKIYPNQGFKGLLVSKIIRSYSTKRMAFNKDRNSRPNTIIYFKY